MSLALIQSLAVSGARGADDAPLASGLVYAYEPGTTTQAAVFADADGTEALTQPITLDGTGKAEVWTAGPVRLVIQDSSGNTISDTDPSNTVRDTQVAISAEGWTESDYLNEALESLWGSLGGSDGSYRLTSSSTDRAVKDVLGEEVSPRDFGAVVDGATDDSAACLSAIAYLASKGGGVLRLPVGTMALANTVAFSTNAITIRGAGVASVVKTLTGIAAFAPSTCNDIGFYNFLVDGPGIAGSEAGIKVHGVTNLTSVGVTVQGHGAGYDIDDDGTNGANNITIIAPNIYFQSDANGCGVSFVGSSVECKGLRVIGGTINSTGSLGDGVRLGGASNTGASGILILNTYIKAKYGVRFPDGSNVVHDTSVMGCNLLDCATDGINIQDTGTGVTRFYEANNDLVVGGIEDHADTTAFATHVWTSDSVARRPYGNQGLPTAVQAVWSGISTTCTVDADCRYGNVIDYYINSQANGASSLILSINAPLHVPMAQHGDLIFLRFQLKSPDSPVNTAYTLTGSAWNFGAGPLLIGTASGSPVISTTNKFAQPPGTPTDPLITYTMMFSGITGKWECAGRFSTNYESTDT